MYHYQSLSYQSLMVMRCLTEWSYLGILFLQKNDRTTEAHSSQTMEKSEKIALLKTHVLIPKFWEVSNLLIGNHAKDF